MQAWPCVHLKLHCKACLHQQHPRRLLYCSRLASWFECWTIEEQVMLLHLWLPAGLQTQHHHQYPVQCNAFLALACRLWAMACSQTLNMVRYRFLLPGDAVTSVSLSCCMAHCTNTKNTTALLLVQRAMEQTAERNVGLQPLVAQLSEAVNEAHMLHQSRQTLGKEYVCLTVCSLWTRIHVVLCACYICI